MTEYRYYPTLKEYDELRRVVRRMFEDYVLLYEMRGVMSLVDLYLDPSEMDQRQADALREAKTLDTLQDRMYSMAVAMGTDCPPPESEWQSVIEQIEALASHHEPLKSMRLLAQGFGISVQEAVTRVRQGAPPGSRDFADRTEFLQAVKRGIEAMQARGARVTRDNTALAVLNSLGRQGRDGEHSNPGFALMRTASSFGIYGWEALKNEAMQI